MFILWLLSLKLYKRYKDNLVSKKSYGKPEMEDQSGSYRIFLSC